MGYLSKNPLGGSLSAIADATFQRKVAHLMIANEILPIILTIPVGNT
ncbi:MAG: hypothetical protein LBL62_07770 [Planctomycetaceae bacterium]|nr:hypothetical protein [Planctomycetaceae bacterium]